MNPMAVPQGPRIWWRESAGRAALSRRRRNGLARKLLSVVGLSLALASCGTSRPEVVVQSSALWADAPLPEIAARSEGIVTGRVIDVRPARWNRAHDQVYTDRIFDVKQWVKGSGPNRITIRNLGGRIGERTFHAGSVAVLPLEQELLLFLKLESGTIMDLDGEYYVSFGPKGAYELGPTMARGLAKREGQLPVEDLLNIARASR